MLPPPKLLLCQVIGLLSKHSPPLVNSENRISSPPITSQLRHWGWVTEEMTRAEQRNSPDCTLWILRGQFYRLGTHLQFLSALPNIWQMTQGHRWSRFKIIGPCATQCSHELSAFGHGPLCLHLDAEHWDKVDRSADELLKSIVFGYSSVCSQRWWS